MAPIAAQIIVGEKRADQRRRKARQQVDPEKKLLIDAEPENCSEDAANDGRHARWTAKDARCLDRGEIKVGVSGGPERKAHGDHADCADKSPLGQHIGREVMGAGNDAAHGADDLQKPLSNHQNDEGNGDGDPRLFGEARIFGHDDGADNP